MPRTRNLRFAIVLLLAFCLPVGTFAADSIPEGQDTVRVAAVQAKRRMVDWHVSDRESLLAAVDKNLDELEHVVHKAGMRKCDVLVFPEDTLGLLNWYGMNEELAKEIVSESVTRMLERLGRAAATHRMYLVVCSDFVESDGATYNTAFLLGRDGKPIGRYHKTCPTWSECGARSRGTSLPVFPTPDLGTVGMLICYDLVVPETARCLALAGADMIFFPTMGGAAVGDDDIGLQALRVRAAENHVYLVVAFRGGGSMIISPRGKIIARAEGPDGLAIADINPRGGRQGGDAMNSQRDMRARLFRERNPAAFGILTDPNPPILKKVPIEITQQAAGRIAARALTIGDEQFQQAESLVRSGDHENAIFAFERLRAEYPGTWIDRVAKERVETLRIAKKKEVVVPETGHGLKDDGHRAKMPRGTVLQADADLLEAKIGGHWRVSSVQLSGEPVPGLEGALLVFANGKKVFTLPDGRVEKGTYKIVATKQPCEIDSTTEGRAGFERGIYAVQGNTLKLCVATGGEPRPRDFTTTGSHNLLIVLRREGVEQTEASPAQLPAGRRKFRMGFTGFVYDISLEAVTASRKFVRETGDILAHHIEGVPWAESLSGQPFSRAMLEEWKGKQSATPPEGKVYLAISPGRGDLKLAEKAAPLPAELKGKSYDDPLVKKAYLNYCRRAVEFFKPDYLAIGIEVNEIHDLGPEAWQAYFTLHQHVYAELKKDHEELPIFATWTLHNMFKKRGPMLEAWKTLMPYNDLVAVSYYPFFMEDKDRLDALDWMTTQFDSFHKPYAMVETNDAAERLPLPEAKVVIEGTTEKQAAYYRRLLALAQRREFEFVISFVHQDYDALWDKIKAHSPELFIAWRDCGLLDENGNARPAYAVWKQYFDHSFEE